MVSIIIPAYNEEKSIGKLLNAVTSLYNSPGYEIIVVNDGSTDTTAEIVSAYAQVKLVSHTKQMGVGAARTTGLKNASGEKVVFIDADMTYNPEDIAKIVDEIYSYDMVVGARREEAGTFKPVRYSVKKLFCILAEKLTGVPIPDLNSGLRGIDKEKALNLTYILPSGHSWVSTITLAFLSSGYTLKFTDIDYGKRIGKSTFAICRDTYGMFITILKTVTYYYPLRVMLPISLFLFLCGSLFLIRDLFSKNLADTTIFLFISGIVIFVFSLLSEQIACLRREFLQKLK